MEAIKLLFKIVSRLILVSVLGFDVPFKFTGLHAVVYQQLDTHYTLRSLISCDCKPKLPVRFIILSKLVFFYRRLVHWSPWWLFSQEMYPFLFG